MVAVFGASPSAHRGGSRRRSLDLRAVFDRQVRDVDALLSAEPIAGVRLLPYDDAYTKLDRELLIPDPGLRARVVPLVGQSTLGHMPGAILVDGEIVGSWQRQQRKVTIHPWSTLSPAVRDAIEAEALAFPIAGSPRPSVAWG